MALVFCDSFDHYDNLTHKYHVRPVGTDPAWDAAKGRNGTAGIYQVYGNNNESYVGRNILSLDTYIVGFAYYFDLKSQPGGPQLVALVDNGVIQVDLRMTTTGKLYFTRNGTTIGSESAASFPFLAYHYIEVKVKVHPTAGEAQVRVDGIPWVTLTNQNTRATALSQINQTRIGGPRYSANTGESRYDDFYICDTSGSQCNDYLGDVRVEALFPDGAGASTQWTPSAGSNYACVDENPPNEDTDYVSSDTPNQKDTYSYANSVIASGEVKAVAVWARARKDDAGERKIHTVARSGSSENESADLSVPTSYEYLMGIHELNPDTGQPWTLSEINAAQFGVKVIA